MKQLKVMLVAALCAVPFAPRAEEPQKVTFDVSGWLIVNGFFNRGELNVREASSYARLNDPDLDQRQFGMAARQSRLRAAIGIPADGLLAGATLKGLVEADFGGSVGGSSDSVIPRLRHFFVSSTWKEKSNFSLLVGQTWGVASNAYFPESNAHYLVPRFGGAGFLYRRAPQVRASADLPAGALGLTVTVAALMPGDATSGANPGTSAPALNQSVGNDATMPNFESRIAAKYSQGGKPMVEAGLWSHYGRERYEPVATGMFKDVTAASAAFGLDMRLTFPYVQVLGQVFTGENLDVLASIAGTFVTDIGAAPAEYKNGVLFDNTDPLNPKVKGIKTQGGFAQLVISPVNRLQLLVGAGMENPDDSSLKLPGDTLVPDGAITRNTQYSAGAIVQLSNRWKVSLEATRFITTVSEGGAEKNRDVLPSTQFEVGSLIAF